MVFSVLVIGSSGRLGHAILEASQKIDGAKMHAFTRSKTNISKEDSILWSSIIEGDALKTEDIKRALLESNADYVVVSVGRGDDLSKTSIRTDTARAITAAIGSDVCFEKVKSIVVSSVGAGESQVKPGMGMGYVIRYVLRFILEDHNGQEEAFLKLDKQSIAKSSITNSDNEEGLVRTLIVRPVNLSEGKAKGKCITFDGQDKTPNLNVDRADVAQYIMKRIEQDSLSDNSFAFAGKVNIASA